MIIICSNLNIQNKDLVSKKSNKKIIILLSTLTPFFAVLLVALIYFFYNRKSFNKKSEVSENFNDNKIKNQTQQTSKEEVLITVDLNLLETIQNQTQQTSKEEVLITVDLNLLETIQNQMGHLLCIDRPFYEEKEIKVQNDVKKNINVKDIGEKTICILENKSTDYKTKYDAVSAFGKELSNLYEKYKEIYETYNPPKNYATIRNMCIIQMIIIVLRHFDQYDEETIKSLNSLILLTQYSSCIKQIMETIVGQYSFVPWIYNTLVENSTKNKEEKFVPFNINEKDVICDKSIKNEILKKVESCIVKIRKQGYKSIKSEVKEFSEGITLFLKGREDFDNEILEGFLTSLESTEEPEEPEDIKGIVYNKKEKFDGDRFDYKTDTKFRKINLFNESEDRKIEIEIDKIAAIRHINIGFERFSSNHVLACSLTSVFTYPNRIYGCNIPNIFKDLTLVKYFIQCEKDIKEKIEKVSSFIILKEHHENNDNEIEDIYSLNSTLLKEHHENNDNEIEDIYSLNSTLFKIMEKRSK